MSCLIIASSPDIFPMPKKNDPFAYRLRERVRTSLLEIYYNGCDNFICPLRRGYEIFVGEMLADMSPSCGYMRVSHLFPYKKYHNCKTAEELYYYQYVSSICDRHINLQTETTVNTIETFVSYCRENVDILFCVCPVESPDDDTETLLCAALDEEKTTIRVDTETLDVIASNIPRNWLTYEEWREIEHYRKNHPFPVYS